MKVPSKRYFENVLQGHLKTQRTVKVKREAASFMFLRYLLFMKTLAKEADNLAYRQKRITMKPADIIEAEKIVGNVSETAKILSEKKSSRSSRSSSDLQSGILESSDVLDKENEHPDTSSSEESE